MADQSPANNGLKHRDRNKTYIHVWKYAQYVGSGTCKQTNFNSYSCESEKKWRWNVYM